MDGWMNGWMNGWMDGWIYKCIHAGMNIRYDACVCVTVCFNIDLDVTSWVRLA